MQLFSNLARREEHGTKERDSNERMKRAGCGYPKAFELEAASVRRRRTVDVDGARSRWLYSIFVGVRVHCSVLHRAIVGATNRPTGGKDARRLLAATISPIICALKQLHGNPVVPRPLSHDRPNSPTGGSGDIIISGPSPEHRIDASGNVFMGLVSPSRRERF